MPCSDTPFARQFKRAGVPNLIRQFGETVTYYADGGDTGREIQAIVERGTMAAMSETDLSTQAITIRVKNDARHGISSSEVDTGADEVSVPLRVGGTAQRRSVVRVLTDANGVVSLLLQ